MQPLTRQLWSKQDRHPGDRRRLFEAVAEHAEATDVLYPGSWVDVAASFTWAQVTYVDLDRRAARFFADDAGVAELIREHHPASPDPQFTFIAGDYEANLGLDDQSFDLLISLYAGFISEHCTRYLRIGGTLLVNPSHGDAAMASIDPRYELSGVVLSRDGTYRVRTTGLEDHMIPRRSTEVTAALLHELGRGIAYSRRAFAYLFTRVR